MTVITRKVKTCKRREETNGSSNELIQWNGKLYFNSEKTTTKNAIEEIVPYAFQSPQRTASSYSRIEHIEQK